MWRTFRTRPRGQDKVVYIAPLKALVRERVREWGSEGVNGGLRGWVGRSVVEMTGDVTPALRMIEEYEEGRKGKSEERGVF